MLDLIGRLPGYKIAKFTGLTPPLPLNYTLGLTYKCQARCKTCNINQRASKGQMTTSEWRSIFQSIGHSPFWVTLTGGETFLYPELCEVYYHLVNICRPKIVNIPTNGQLVERIPQLVWDMAKVSPDTQLIINVSLDHYDHEKNDEIRGLKGYYNNAIRTIRNLRELLPNIPNVELGIHTVISIYNVDDIPEIRGVLSKLLPNPANYITEIAEGREELKTLHTGITPTKESYSYAISPLLYNIQKGVKPAFRRRYYSNVCKVLGNEKTIPCYAGYSSCQITPHGDVWACCIKAENMGNLREYHYDFRKLWRSDKAGIVRDNTEKCYCPMANVSYTNMMLDLRTAVGIMREII